ncbi:hypothetical protein N431DRAFT_473137 [Stipitochalara longipes BDJ]|nr:hypothetical protein N431DRAFT_473137 [Stipitochalara longipes BDJ]
MTSPQSTCATYGSTESNLAHECSTSESQSSQSKSDNSPNFSAFRIADYLNHPTTSHVQLQHISSQETTRIYNEKKLLLEAVNDTLNDNKK